jgi:hypothetical protein
VANVQASGTYPAVTGCMLQIGQRRAFLDGPAISRVEEGSVTSRTARIDMRGFQHGEGQVLLARDILHHQLVTTGDVHVIRAADLYLAQAGGQVRLVGATAARPAQLPRFARQRWHTQPSPGRVIDWAEIEWLGPSAGEPAAVRLRSSHSALRRLRPAGLADVPEELATPAQREVLASLDRQMAADALEEMDPHQLTALLRGLPSAEAAALISGMEPDEAADPLRNLPAAEQSARLARMPQTPSGNSPPARRPRQPGRWPHDHRAHLRQPRADGRASGGRAHRSGRTPHRHRRDRRPQHLWAAAC